MPNKRPQRGSKDLPSYVTNLSAHASGMWTTRLTLPDGSKKQVYLCSWKTADYKEALRVRDERQGEVDANGDDSLKRKSRKLDASELIHIWLTGRKALVESGELAASTYASYERIANGFLDSVGDSTPALNIGPREFAAYRATLTGAASTRGLAVRVIRACFNYLRDIEVIPAVKFGVGFKPPSGAAVARERATKITEKGEVYFNAAEVKLLLSHADDRQRAVVLLALNAAYGQADLCAARWNCIDLENGIVTMARVKTGVARSAVLWPETIEALKAVKPADATGEDYVFPNRRGGKTNTDVLAVNFNSLQKKAGIFKEHSGRGVYGCRRSFATFSSVTHSLAVDHVLGHINPQTKVSGLYRRHISREDLADCCEYVREQLGIEEACKG